MEGIGYWIFLLLIYGLSALLRKRQQKAARRKINLDEPSPSPTVKRPDLFKEFFGSEWEPAGPEQIETEELELDEHELVPAVATDQAAAAPIGPAPPGIYEKEKRHQADYLQPPPVEMPGASHGIDTAIVKGQDVEQSAIRSRVLPSRRVKQELIKKLKEPDALRYSIMVHEILGKPRALKPGIR